jgi:hypothetical protein
VLTLADGTGTRWTEFVALIAPHAPAKATGRRLLPVEGMRRIHWLYRHVQRVDGERFAGFDPCVITTAGSRAASKPSSASVYVFETESVVIHRS